MERMLATPADAEIILKLYELRTEAVMRQARAWMTGEFWPATAEEYFAVAENPGRSTQRVAASGAHLLGDGGGDGAARRGLGGAFCGLQRRGLFSAGQVCADSGSDPGEESGFSDQDLRTGEPLSSAAQRYEGILKSVEARRSSWLRGRRRTASMLILRKELTQKGSCRNSCLGA